MRSNLRFEIFLVVSLSLFESSFAVRECRDSFGFNYMAAECDFQETETFRHTLRQKNLTINTKAILSNDQKAVVQRLLNGTTNSTGHKCITEYKIEQNGTGYTSTITCMNITSKVSLLPAYQRCLPVDLHEKSDSNETDPFLPQGFLLNFETPPLGPIEVDYRHIATDGCGLHFDVVATEDNKTDLFITGGGVNYMVEAFYGNGRQYKPSHTVKSHISLFIAPSTIDGFFTPFRTLQRTMKDSIVPFVPDHPRLTDLRLCHFADYSLFETVGYCRVTQLIINPTNATARTFLDLKVQLHATMLFANDSVKVYLGIEQMNDKFARFVLVIYCRADEELLCDKKYAFDMEFLKNVSSEAKSNCFDFQATAEPLLIPGNPNMVGINETIESPLRTYQGNDTAFCTAMFSSYPFYQLRKYKVPLKKIYYDFGNFPRYEVDYDNSLGSAQIRRINKRLEDFYKDYIAKTMLRNNPKRCTTVKTKRENNFFGERRKVVFCVCVTTLGRPCNNEQLLLPYIYTLPVHHSSDLTNDKEIIEHCLDKNIADVDSDINLFDPAIRYDFAPQTLCVIQLSKHQEHVAFDRFDTYRYQEREIPMLHTNEPQDAPYISKNSWTYSNRHERLNDPLARALMHVICQSSAAIVNQGCNCAHVTSIDNVLCCCTHKEGPEYLTQIRLMTPLTLGAFYENIVLD